MDVVMPQMGESVAEGTIVRWMKKVGDTVDPRRAVVRDLDGQSGCRNPSPAAGVLSEIRAKEGDTFPSTASSPSSDRRRTWPRRGRHPRSAHAEARRDTPIHTPPQTPVPASSKASENIARDRTSPLVPPDCERTPGRLAQVAGTGIGGRVTKDDVLAFVARGGPRENKDGKGRSGRTRSVTPRETGSRRCP